jgi:protease-4
MPRLLASVLVLASLPLVVAACVTVNTFGPRREAMEETIVHGTTGPKVLLLDIDNLITDVDIEGPLGLPGPESTVSRVREQLDEARESLAAAILLRINSPGGGVTASDVIYREIVRFKEEEQVPVVAQLMGLAASGGYYVAMAADYVIAHPTTVTGSIGVIAPSINFAGLMERYGVRDQTLVGGTYKDAGSSLRPMTPAERAYLQKLIDDLHARFREVVDEGRPELDENQVLAIADGRVFTAKKAAEVGLVDAIGYMPDAIDEIKRRIQAPEIRVVSYHRKREWRANLYSTAPAPPRSQADLVQRLGLDRGPTFLYLWWPGSLPQ